MGCELLQFCPTLEHYLDNHVPCYCEGIHKRGSHKVEVQMYLHDMDMDRKRDVFCRQHIMISDSSRELTSDYKYQHDTVHGTASSSRGILECEIAKAGRNSVQDKRTRHRSASISDFHPM